jgi:hypothetical protein
MEITDCMLRKRAMAFLMIYLIAISVAFFIGGNRSLPLVQGSSVYISSVASPEIDVCIHLNSFNNPMTIVADMKGLGVSWVRIDWIPGQMSDFMQAMRTNNISVLAIIDINTLGNNNFTITQWNSNLTSIMQEPNANYVGAWEIWNEPNDKANVSVEFYHQMLQSAHTIIKNATIIGAGLSPNAKTCFPFLSALYSYNDMRSLVNYQGVHVYDGDVDVNLANITAIQQISNKPIWVTEYGKPSAPSNESTEQGQADWLQSNFEPLQTHAAKTFWYELYDESVQGSTKENSFGLIKLNETRKPAFDVLLTLAHTDNGTTTDPTVTPKVTASSIPEFPIQALERVIVALLASTVLTAFFVKKRKHN